MPKTLKEFFEVLLKDVSLEIPKTFCEILGISLLFYAGYLSGKLGKINFLESDSYLFITIIVGIILIICSNYLSYLHGKMKVKKDIKKLKNTHSPIQP